MRRPSGFTIIELVMTLIIIGILAAVAIARIDFSAFSERGYHDKLKATLQYARKAAVGQRRYVCVGVSAGIVTFTVDASVPESTPTPFGTCPYAKALVLPSPDTDCGGGGNQVCPPSGVTLTATAGSFQFDAAGRASAAVTFNMTGQPDITVEQETGYVR